jgi:hypothetical protein
VGGVRCGVGESVGEPPGECVGELAGDCVGMRAYACLCPMCRHVNENIYVTNCREPTADSKIKN